MARIVIHYALSRHEATENAMRFIRKAVREMRFIARLAVSHGPYTTGRLAQSLHSKGPFLEGFIIRAQVGSDLHYARLVNSGARPHLIFPIPPHTYMKFYWRKVGRVVYLDKVRHPGQRGKGYLEEAARTIGRRYNLRVVIYP